MSGAILLLPLYAFMDFDRDNFALHIFPQYSRPPPPPVLLKFRLPIKVSIFSSNIERITPLRTHAGQLHADGRTDRTKRVVTFRSFTNAAKIVFSSHAVYLCVLCGCQNKQRLLLYTALTGWFL